MVTVSELRPGDVVILFLRQGTFISSSPHPNYPGLSLVIWKLDDGTWSLDALAYHQEVGELIPSTPNERWARVQEAFRA